MRLEVASFQVQDLEFGARTALGAGTLVVDRDEVRQIVLEDSHFADVEVHVARPGDSVRIVHALDVVEPRWKVAGPGGVFPGFVSPPTTVGEGRTHRLAGVAVVDVGEPVPGEPTFWRERLIDMAGPGAELGPFGQTLNLVLHFRPNLDFFPPDAADVKNVIEGSAAAKEYNRAVTLAGMKVAAHLARASQAAEPDEVETFELGPCDPALPRVVCIYQQQRFPGLYGVTTPLPHGAIVHPNECFDGALIGQRADATSGATYWEQNQEVLLQLCRRHGKAWSFLGCIVFGGATPYREDKERVSSAVAKLARILGAQGAVVLGVNGSNYAVDLMWTIQKCEQAGIKTSLIYQDVGHEPDDPGFIFAVSEADAVVCTGSRERLVTLPAMQALIGGDRLINPDVDARGEITIPLRYVHSAVDIQGYNYLTTRFA